MQIFDKICNELKELQPGWHGASQLADYQHRLVLLHQLWID